MKKVFMFLAVMGVMAFSAQNVAAQDQTAEPTATEETAAPAEEAANYQTLGFIISVIIL